jgi:hypothetical protein
LPRERLGPGEWFALFFTVVIPAIVVAFLVEMWRRFTGNPRP